MIAVIVLPLLGYFGAKTYSRKLILMYLIYLIAIIIVRVALISITSDDAYIAVQSVIVLLEILVIVYIIKLHRTLGKLTEEEKFYLIGPQIMNYEGSED
mmetsp:Transcript_35230/g.6338  ORF Transcript_35230/g.6338 Transcript_35230/m.6338 type:complete len:99 (-) Transcript_35230:74-370(-)